MNELQTIFDQFRLFAAQHAPEQLMSHAVLAGIGILALGIAVSVFGAKLARWGVAGVFALMGAVVGALFAQSAGFPALPCVLVSGAMVAAIGCLTHRLWVGVMTSIVVSAVVLCGLGFQRVAPHVASFDPVAVPMAAWSAADRQSEFTLPTPAEQEEYRDRTPGQWFQGLWDYVCEQDASVSLNAKALALAAAVIGLFVGVLAVRFTLIVSTSIIGTLLVTSGLGALGTHLWPGLYQAGFNHPAVVGMAVGAFLVTSLILQTMLTRQAKPKPAESAEKS